METYRKSVPTGVFEEWADEEFRAIERTMASMNLTVATVSSTSYTFGFRDKDRIIKFTSGSAVTATVPTLANSPYRIGNTIHFTQWGAGQVTVVGDTGVTVRSRIGLKSAGQYAVCSLIKIDSNEWVMTGDMTA